MAFPAGYQSTHEGVYRVLDDEAQSHKLYPIASGKQRENFVKEHELALSPPRHFYRDFAKLLINVLPSITASVGKKGRTTSFKAVGGYLRNDSHVLGISGLLKAFVNTTA